MIPRGWLTQVKRRSSWKRQRVGCGKATIVILVGAPGAVGGAGVVSLFYGKPTWQFRPSTPTIVFAENFSVGPVSSPLHPQPILPWPAT